MFNINQEVFFVSGPYKGFIGRIGRTDGPIPGFPYRLTVPGAAGGYVWMDDSDFVALPPGFIPIYGQGNIEPPV